jgi:hypothetical protein
MARGPGTEPIDPIEPSLASRILVPGGFPVGSLPINHPELARLFRYWDRRRGERAMPAYADIDVAELAELQANLFSVDIVAGDVTAGGAEPRFRYREVGSALTAIMEQDLVGKFVDEMPLLFRKFALPAYREILRARRPTYKETNRFEGWMVIRYRRLMLPLSSDGETIDTILGAIYRF